MSCLCGKRREGKDEIGRSALEFFFLFFGVEVGGERNGILMVYVVSDEIRSFDRFE